jgi:hypothetical protein
MASASAAWFTVGTLALLAAAACGGRTLTSSPGDGGNALDGSSTSSSSGGGIDVGAGSGVGGTGAQGGGATGGSGPGSGGSGGGPPDPQECILCLFSECPEGLDCITDPVCGAGLICTFTNCLSGGGTPDIGCVIDCFDGDLNAALQAFEAITCVFGSCAEECGGFLDGGFLDGGSLDSDFLQPGY